MVRSGYGVLSSVISFGSGQEAPLLNLTIASKFLTKHILPFTLNLVPFSCPREKIAADPKPEKLLAPAFSFSYIHVQQRGVAIQGKVNIPA
jgi:hypothetical protein